MANYNDPNDPYPDESKMGGAAFARAVAAWNKRHQPKPGPAKKPSVTNHGTSHGGGKGGGAYDLSKYTAGAIAQAEQEASEFAGWLGWPTWFDWNAMTKKILQLGLHKDPQKAYEFLWTQLNPDRQKANINAYFGLNTQQYLEQMNNLKDMYQLYTGDTGIPDPLRNQALKEHWTQSELMAALQKDPHVGETAPWLTAGQTFRDVSSQFASQYGVPVKDKQQLQSWWKFRSGAQTVGAAGPAIEVPMSQRQRVAGADVEAR